MHYTCTDVYEDRAGANVMELGRRRRQAPGIVVLRLLTELQVIGDGRRLGRA